MARMAPPFLHHDTATIRRRRRLSNTWALFVIGWSLIRTLIVWAAVGDYGLNPWLYLVLDLVSATIDAISTPRMVIRFVDDQYRKALQWALISLAAFVMPDIYIFAGTRTLPGKLIVIIVAVISVTLLAAVVAVLRKVRKGRELQRSLQAD